MGRINPVIFSGQNEFSDALGEKTAKMLEAAHNIVAKGSLIIAGHARETFRGNPGGKTVSAKGNTYYSFKPPYQATPPMPTSRSGRLQRSVGTYYKVTEVPGGWESKVGARVSYARYVEFGTSRMAKEPFMSVGIDRSRTEIESLAEYEWAQAAM